jgi:hypothetical protein
MGWGNGSIMRYDYVLFICLVVLNWRWLGKYTIHDGSLRLHSTLLVLEE